MIFAQTATTPAPVGGFQEAEGPAVAVRRLMQIGAQLVDQARRRAAAQHAVRTPFRLPASRCRRVSVASLRASSYSNSTLKAMCAGTAAA
jgi:hypothetical protein